MSNKSQAAAIASLHAKEPGPAPSDGADRSVAADVDFSQIVQNLPVAVYSTDAAGRLTFYNEAAASLWGRHPKLGQEWWCGSWRLYWPDGRPMGHDECPMAVALKTGCAARGEEAIAERPDGVRVPFLAYPTPLRNAAGQLIGAVNTLVDITERKQNEEAARHYAAIVESSDDAILSKDVNGVIMSWNNGAQRLFGYTSEEAVGKSVTLLIPVDRHDEEPKILERIRRGERIDHYETVRQRKDGSLVDISLTVSPIRDRRGTYHRRVKDCSRHYGAQEGRRAAGFAAQGDGSSHPEPFHAGDRHCEFERPLGEERPGSGAIVARTSIRSCSSLCANAVARRCR